MNQVEQDGVARLARIVRSAQERTLTEQPVSPPDAYDVTRRGLARRRTRRLARIGGASIGLAALALVAAAALRGPRDVTFVAGARVAGAGEYLAATDHPLPLRFSDGTEVSLAPAARGRVVSVDPDGAHVLLERGRADVFVRHRPRARWTFRTGPFLVAVTGTRFSISWEPQAERLELAMHEGAVLVSGGALQSPRPVVAGEVLRASARDGHFTIEGSAPDVEPVPAPEPPSLAPEEAPAPPVRRVRREDRPAPPTWQSLAASGRYGDALAAADREGFPRLLAHAPAADLLALADVARYSGDAQRGQVALTALRRRFPRDARAAIAAFALGRLAFDERRAFPEAARWFEVYLREQPSGPLARDAAGRLVEARDRAGDHDGARAAARSYLARHPEGPHAALARSVLAR